MDAVRGGILLMLTIIYAGHCEGQKFSLGACRTITPQTITLANPGLLGQWFEWARTPNIGEHGWKCVTYTFATVVMNVQLSLNVRGVNKLALKRATLGSKYACKPNASLVGDGRLHRVLNPMAYEIHASGTGATKTAAGTVNIIGTPDANNVLNGMLSVLFNNNKILLRANPVVYSVIGRDAPAAANFITLYACSNLGIGKIEYVVILTSSRTPTIATLDAAFNAATAAGVPAALIKKTDQTGC